MAIMSPKSIINCHCGSKGSKDISLYTMAHSIGENSNYPIFLLDIPVKKNIAAYPFTIKISLLAVNLYIEIFSQMEELFLVVL